MTKKKVTVKTSKGTKYYTINIDSGKYRCSKDSSGMFGSSTSLGKANNLNDALSLIRSHATTNFGTVKSVDIS